MSVDDTPGSPANRLTAIWLRFRDTTLGRVDQLDEAVIALLENRLTDDMRRTAEREAHKLAGSSGTFGFPRASTIARDLERQFASETLTHLDVVPLSDLLVQLRTDLEGSPQAFVAPKPEAVPGIRTALLIVEGDPAIMERLTMEAEGRGFAAVEAASVAAAAAALMAARPDIAVIGFGSTESNSETLGLLDQFQSQSPPVPAIVVMNADGVLNRVDFARRGARRCLEKPVSPRTLIDAVESVWAEVRGSDGTILAVDDDPQILALLGALLPPLGLKLVTLQDPMRFWQQLEETNPDLIMLDVDMPQVNGVELCRIVRNDARWASVPIVFLTARSDPASIEKLFTAGADDHLIKPIVASEVVVRVTNRLARTRLQRKGATVDASTGLRNRERSAMLVERFVHLARRTMQPLSVAIVTVDALATITETHGPAVSSDVLRTLAQLLASSVRAEEVVGRWDGDEIIVADYGSDHAEFAERLSAILSEFSVHDFTGTDGYPIRAAARAAIAAFPGDGEDHESLAAAARGATHQISGGPAHVRFVRRLSGDAPFTIDVVIVDDDEALGGLVAHGVSMRGLETQRFDDGEAAAAALAGANPPVRARLILLDVDLPGLNGYDLLRRLVRDGVTRRTKVIMLTARNAEGDVLAGLEMGAIDHVSKPFNLPVLLQKITAALRDRPE